MKGDYSNDTFDPAKHFTRVLMQQGRVQLDSDWNEQAAILLHYLQTLARDLIGPHGGPRESPGFEIGVVTNSSSKITDLLIGVGRYYVDGILCEIEEQAPSEFKSTNRDIRYSSDEGALRYRGQPVYPRDLDLERLFENLPLLVYLDVWERHICALEDPDIREIALGGPDTAARAKVVWQVNVSEWNGDAEITCDEFEASEAWRKLVEDRQPTNRGYLKARAQIPEDAQDACVVSPEARYRGAENQLYRVEIHRGGTENSKATFKWSRENGSVVFPIQRLAGSIVTLENLGRDDRFGIEVGNWVEIVDDDYSLLRMAERLLRIKKIDPASMEITLSGPSESNVGQDSLKHPMLRRWDQQTGDSSTGGLTLDEGGAALVVEDAWLNLEDGIQVLFQAGGNYRTGDYWLIPARTETGDVEWPVSPDGPEARPPRGVQHHYAPLALVFSRSGPALADHRFDTTDLRHHFGPASGCCPTIALDYPRTVDRGDSITFTVRINPKQDGIKLKWEVVGSVGAITGPSDQVSCEVRPNADATAVTAKVTITGLPSSCRNTAQGTSNIRVR